MGSANTELDQHGDSDADVEGGEVTESSSAKGSTPASSKAASLPSNGRKKSLFNSVYDFLSRFNVALHV